MAPVGTDSSPARGAVGVIGLGEIGQVHLGSIRLLQRSYGTAVVLPGPDLG
jgi:hypothetical protein